MKKETVDGGEIAATVRKDHKWLRRIAAAVISVILLASGVLMLNVNVRAAVLGVFSGQESEETSCFDPYVFSEEFGEGDYDVLFTYQGEIAYYLVINLTPELY